MDVFGQAHPGVVAGGVGPVGAAGLGQGDDFPDEVADLLEGAIGIFLAGGNDGPGSKDRESQVSLYLQSEITSQDCSAQMGLTVLAEVQREITAYSLENSQERTGTASRLGAATYTGLCVSSVRILNHLGA